VLRAIYIVLTNTAFAVDSKLNYFLHYLVRFSKHVLYSFTELGTEE